MFQDNPLPPMMRHPNHHYGDSISSRSPSAGSQRRNVPTAAATAAAGHDTKIRVQVSLHATRLRKKSGLGASADPFAVVTLVDENKRDGKILGQTETISNTTSPAWTKVFYLDHEFGKETFINVGVWDEKQKRKNSAHKLMGSAAFEVGSVLGARGNIKSKNLKRGGTVFCHVERAALQSSGELVLQLRGVKLKNVERFAALRGSKSDPFFELSRKIDGPGGKTWRKVLRSPHLDNNLNPTWDVIRTDMDILCDGERRNPILISVFDFQSSGKHVHMGRFETTVEGLLNAAQATAAARRAATNVDSLRCLTLLDLRGRPAGQIVVLQADVDTSGTGAEPTPTATSATPTASTSVSSRSPPPPPASPATLPPPPPPAPTSTSLSGSLPTASTHRPSRQSFVSIPPAPRPAPRSSAPSDLFVDYITGGLQLRLCFAIDLTGSNGDPREPGTLHYVDEEGYELNDYERAIVEVGSIVAKYDHDQQFPVWGFGAKYDGILRHCFQIGPTAEATGVEGVLQYYRSVFDTPMCMSGPTVFDEVILTAASQAASAQEAAQEKGEQSYTILLILSDGAVSDVHACRETIREVSGVPLSIVIVGIGKDDFSAMQMLDDFAQGSSGRDAPRDIVQFVEYDAFRKDPSKLRQATLEEIPSQVVTYFQQQGIDPLQPRERGSHSDVSAEEHDEDFDLDLDVLFDGETGEVVSLAGMIPTSLPVRRR